MKKWPPIRKFLVAQTLESVAMMHETIKEITEDEVLHCLQIESSTQRRQVVIDTLIRRAAKLNKQKYINQLKENYGVPYHVKDSGNGDCR